MGHLRVHTNLPGPLSEGNRTADRYIQFVAVSQELTRAHSLPKCLLLSAGSLSLHTGINTEEAVQTVKNCPLSMEFLLVPHLGINP